ncbi:MAG: PAS domain S-box protein [Gaiellaceae bacterium]
MGTSRSALPLRLYFGLLFALVLVGAVAGVVYVDRTADADARSKAEKDALFSARVAAKQLDDHLQLLKSTAAGLAANPQIVGVLENPEGCTLSFQGLGGPDRGHLDIVRADGTVACSSKPPAAQAKGYGSSSWFDRSLARPTFVAPVRDPRFGGHVAIATAPLPGGKGVVAASADLNALGRHLAAQYGGGRPNIFLITTADDRTVIARSRQPERWIGTKFPPGRLDHRPGAEWRDLEGNARLYARAPVPVVGWNTYVGEEKSSVLASVGTLRNRQLQTIAVSLALFLLAAALVYRMVVAPIRRLSASVRSTGELETRDAVPVTGPAEVRALAEDVNFLTASVRGELDRRRASEERYRLLFESNPSPMWVFDAATRRFLAVNDAAVDAYGHSREEFLAMTIEDIRPPQEAARLREVLEDPDDARGRGLRHAGLWRHRRKDGTEFDVEIHSHDHRFQGRPARVVIALDVTDRLESERLLRASEARYRDLFENATDLIAACDIDGRLTAVNEAFVRALGYTREELLQMRVEDLVPEEGRSVIPNARERKLTGAEEASIYEHELVARDGRRIQVEVASRLIFENDRPVGTEAICRDITDRKSLEEQLRQAQRLEAIGRLAGGVAHDFNNLLTVISGYAESLLEGRDRESEPELDQIAVAAERAALLTRQLLAFSRRQVVQPRVVQVNEVVEGLTPMLERLIGEDVELVTSLAHELGFVRADPGQLEQVILNLAVNARDAMPGGGRLTIQTSNVDLDEEYVAHHGESTVGPHVMLSVGDSGQGMDTETLSHMFEPFFTTKPVGTGTGLGLATVYGIVKQSGGSIWIYSEPGKGTTLKIYLPRVEAAVADDLGLPAPAVAAAHGTETILVAEDEPSLRRLSARILEKHGYEVVVAESATDAVRIVEANGRTFDLLLTDLIMPELSGAALAERVRRLVPGIRVLFMSGYADDVVTKNGALEPGAPFLEKPFTANELAAKVRELLDAPA